MDAVVVGVWRVYGGFGAVRGEVASLGGLGGVRGCGFGWMVFGVCFGLVWFGDSRLREWMGWVVVVVIVGEERRGEWS